MSGIEAGAERATVRAQRIKARADAEVISIKSRERMRAMEAKEKMKRAKKPVRQLPPAIGIIGNTEGIPITQMRVGAGAFDKGYRDAIDSGPTMRDVVERRKAHGKVTRKGEENIALRVGLGLGYVDVLPKTKEEAKTRKKGLWHRIIGSIITLGAAVSPIPYKISAEAHQEHLRVERNKEEFRERVEAFNAHLREEVIPPGVQHVRPAEVSRIMHDALQARGSAMPLNPLMRRMLGLPDSVTELSADTVVDIDVATALQGLWEYKNERRISSGAASAEGLSTFPPEYRRALEEGQLWRSSLDAQLADAYGPGGGRESITQIFARGMNWQEYAERENIGEHAELLQQLVGSIDPMMIYATYMAELVPAEGMDAMAQTDLMLRLGGQQFFLNIPSVYDDESSRGGSQATKYVFNRYGAVTRVGPYISEHAFRALQIPQGTSVNMLPNAGTFLSSSEQIITRGELPTRPYEIDSMRLDEVVTLMNYVQSLTTALQKPEARAGLAFIAEQNSSVRLLEYIDMAHNNPREALLTLIRWHRHHDISRPMYLDMDIATEPGRIARGHGERSSADYQAMVRYFDQRAIDMAVNRSDSIRLTP